MLVTDDPATTSTAIDFHLDPTPLSGVLDLSDLSCFSAIQQLGQVVNGAFDLDVAAYLIRSPAPIAPGALLVLGSPGKSQEATYRVRFLGPRHSKWLGLSHFHAGRAVVMPSGGARSFLAWGDHSGAPEEWAIATNPPANVEIQRGRANRVRHQIQLNDLTNRVRFRIWPEEMPEPDTWICEAHEGRLPRDMPRHKAASFSLFQHMGMPVEWSDIRLRAMEDEAFEPVNPSSGRQPFFKRERPGAF